MPTSSRSSSSRSSSKKPSARPADSSARSSLVDDIERAAGEGMTAHKPATRPVASASASGASSSRSSSRGASASQNEGEGSRTAARRYNEGVERTVRSGRVDELGDKAARALEGPEGASLRQAEHEARQGKPRSSKR